MVVLFEITPEGERLTIESRQDVIKLLSGIDFANANFRGGTIYTNPLHLASDLVDGTYVILVETDKNDSHFTPIKASAEVRNWLRAKRRSTSYEALLQYIGRR